MREDDAENTEGKEGKRRRSTTYIYVAVILLSETALAIGS